jgi:hypothetical protein
VLQLVVYQSSETSTNQSDVIIRSDDRFLNLVVDSDSIVSKIYMLNFVLWLVFFFCLHTDKNIAVLLSQLVFFALSHTDKHLAILSKRMYCCCVSIIIVICICPPGALIWLINLFLFLFHIWTSLLFIYFP